MACTEGHSKDVSGYIKYMVELKKKKRNIYIYIPIERGAEVQQIVSHEHEPQISNFSITYGLFFQLDFLGDKVFYLE